MTTSQMTEVLWHKDVAAATCGRLIVSSLATRLTVDMVEALFDAAADHRARWNSNGLSLTVLKPNVAVPEPAARDRVKEIQTRPGAAMASVVIIDGTGFYADGDDLVSLETEIVAFRVRHLGL